MKTFDVVHAVDFSSGTARIGKCHVVNKADELNAYKRTKSVKKMLKKRGVISK